MQRTFLFVINPISGTRSKQGLEAWLRRRIARHHLQAILLHSQPGTTAEWLRHHARQNGTTDMVAVGGDGTVNLVAAAVAGTPMRMAIVPVGSGNGLARCAGIPLKPSGAFEVLMHGSPQPTDAFTVNGQFACMLCGVGFDAAVAHRFAVQKKRGLFTYARLTLLQYLHFKPAPFVIRAGGLSLDTDAYMVTVANSNQFGNNVTIAPMANLTDGLLDVVVIKKQPRWMLPISLLRQVGGGFKMHRSGAVARGQHVVYVQAAALTVECTKLLPVHIDGEPAGHHSKLNIAVLPGAFTLWVPKPAT